MIHATFPYRMNKTKIYRLTFVSALFFGSACGPKFPNDDVAAQVLAEPSCQDPTILTDACKGILLSSLRIEQDSFVGQEDVLQSVLEGFHFILSHPAQLNQDDLLFGKIPITQLEIPNFINQFLQDESRPLNERVFNYIANRGTPFRYGCLQDGAAATYRAETNVCSKSSPLIMAGTLFHEAHHADGADHDIDCPNKSELGLSADFPKECDISLDKTHGWVALYNFSLAQGAQKQPAFRLNDEEIPPQISVLTMASNICRQFKYLYQLSPTAQLAKDSCASYETALSSDLIFSANNSEFHDDYSIGETKAFVTGDFDQDGKLDLVSRTDVKFTFQDSSHYTAPSLVFIAGQGNGHFGSPSLPLFRGNENEDFVGPITADINQDGKPDIVIVFSNKSKPRIAVFLNQGNRIFQKVETPFMPLDKSLLGPINATDVNQDGVPDLLLLDVQNQGFFVALANQDGSFVTPIKYYRCSSHPYSVVASDLNQDGKIDLLISAGGEPVFENHAEIWIGQGNGSFLLNQSLSLLLGSSFVNSSIADMNSDSLPDLVVFYQEKLQIFFGQGNGLFASQVSIEQQFEAQGIFQAELLDLDQDGRLDIVLSTRILDKDLNFTDGISFFIQQPDKKFTPSLQLLEPFLEMQSMHLADVNGDGKKDIILNGHDNLRDLNGVSVLLDPGSLLRK